MDVSQRHIWGVCLCLCAWLDVAAYFDDINTHTHIQTHPSNTCSSSCAWPFLLYTLPKMKTDMDDTAERKHTHTHMWSGRKHTNKTWIELNYDSSENCASTVLVQSDISNSITGCRSGQRRKRNIMCPFHSKGCHIKQLKANISTNSILIYPVWGKRTHTQNQPQPLRVRRRTCV